MKKSAIVSVTDKEGLDILIKGLADSGFSVVIASGKTYTALDILIKKLKLKITLKMASEVTGFPEILDGRIKTIHPKIEGAILWDRKNPRHLAASKKFDLLDLACVVCNFYEIKENEIDLLSEHDLRERIDIGGPALVMSAIKNWPYVIVLTRPEMYDEVFKELKEQSGELSAETRKRLAAVALNDVATNRDMLATTLSKRWTGEDSLRLHYRNGKQLGRYGENYHQKAWIYLKDNVKETSVVHAKKRSGPDLGFNNYIDLQSALLLVMDTKDPACVVIKHNNPCGYATGKTLIQALERAWQGDPISAYGCVLGFNRPVDKDTISVICDRENFMGKTGWFVEAIIAPKFSDEAIKYVGERKTKQGLRILEAGDFKKEREGLEFRDIIGGLLVQTRDNSLFLVKETKDLFRAPVRGIDEVSGKELTVGIVTKKKPDVKLAGLFEFAYRVCAHAKSNAVVICREYQPGLYQLIGLGAGQPNRMNSAERLSIPRAYDNLKMEYKIMKGKGSEGENAMLKSDLSNLRRIGKTLKDSEASYIKKQLNLSVSASDAFFPFSDGVISLAKAGIGNIIQPGGSLHDDEVIAAADKNGIGMIFTGRRHFNH